MAKYIKAKEIGEPNNRLAIFVEVLDVDFDVEPSGELRHGANLEIAADPNPSEEERSCSVSLCLTYDKSIRCTLTARQLGKGSTEETHVVTMDPKYGEVVISALGTEKKPDDYDCE